MRRWLVRSITVLKIFGSQHDGHVEDHATSRIKLFVLGRRSGTIGEKSYNCDLVGCRKTELSQIICPLCDKNFCLGHRHPADHSCDKLEPPVHKMTKTSEHVAEILQKSKVDKTPRKKKLTKKAKETAAKVNLMRLKMKATGSKSIPDSERLYFNFYLPFKLKLEPKALFVSRLWSVGRVIDAVAMETNLRNENNVVGSKKLKLFDTEGAVLMADRTVACYVCEEDALFNGSDLILEYVDENINNFLTLCLKAILTQSVPTTKRK
ncbi:hypothetical protein LSH36_141g10083 [Paralvinella palmiformis]|uniref:AN1-type domain-containing protein n=1 Tax=Paralvinella palmiformis TaxID=53620 RepID=A0AAD9N7U9_9ANNE|nr:hypothetical protein LSH36_141g10083 [Paralvinella palmiformis]